MQTFIRTLVLVLGCATLSAGCESSRLEPDPDAGTPEAGLEAGRPEAGVDLSSDVDAGPAAPFTWAVSVGGSSVAVINDLAVDGTGNIYITGIFGGTASFGATTLTAAGPAGSSQDSFVAKLDSKGAFLWAVMVSSTSSYENSRQIVVDGAGNSYISGTFLGLATFGSKTLFSLATVGFVAKLDPGGNFLWAVINPAGTSAGPALALDGAGNLHIAGGFMGKRTFGATTLTSTPQGGLSAFMARLGSDGKPVWAVAAGGEVKDEYAKATAIAIDGAGKIYITGTFGGTASFGATTLTAQGSPGSDVFVAALDPTGAFLWATSASCSEPWQAWGFTVGSGGSSYLTGAFTGTAKLGSHGLYSGKNGSSGLASDLFVAKLDASGSFAWAVQAGGSVGYNGGYDLAVDSAGSVYVAGEFSDTSSFGSTTLNARGKGPYGGDPFVAKLDPSGTFVWAHGAGGAGLDYANAIGLDSAGGIYLAGDFGAMSDGYKPLATASFGATTLTSKGSGDGFVARLAP